MSRGPGGVGQDGERQAPLTATTPAVDAANGSTANAGHGEKRPRPSPPCRAVPVPTVWSDRRSTAGDTTLPAGGRERTATPVTVPELDGTQAETPVHDDVPTDGLATVRRGIFGLGSQEDGRSTRRYTDTVTARHA